MRRALVVPILAVALLCAASVQAQTDRELTGKDGAPMLLVPAGEFLYGDNNQSMSLSAFYMDKYEVTTRLYATFLQSSVRWQPDNWSKQLAIDESGNRPVVKVSWHHADAYCRHYGKRLPTEQEWEKAARGTDGRVYPWGNETPTSRHALFGTSWNGFATLAIVGSHVVGASPYGVLDMAGNVWEWTNSDYDKFNKVYRGGSWWSESSDMLRSSFRGGMSSKSRTNDVGFRCAQDAR